MNATVGRFPFVSKFDIVREYRPGVEPSDSLFRTLRKRQLASGGTNIRIRRHGRAAGQLRCYSALNLDAVLLARLGRTVEAEEVAAQAESFEREWSSTLADAAETFEVADFQDLLQFRNQLAHALGPASIQLETIRSQFRNLLVPNLREHFVQIASITSQWATLNVVARELSEPFAGVPVVHAAQAKQIQEAFAAIAEPLQQGFQQISAPLNEAISQLVVDPLLPLDAGLAAGDLAVLRVERSQGGSLVSLIAAVGDSNEDVELDAQTLAYFSDEPLTQATLAIVEQRRSVGESVTVPAGTVTLAS